MSAAVDYAYMDLLKDAKPSVVHADEQYREMLNRLSALVVRNDLNEAQERLVELLALLIKTYEQKRFKPPEKARGVEVVKHLMEVHGLKNKDLVPSVFESESVASAVLKGARDLTLKHIQRLASRFELSTDVFIDPE
jgi:HTH-type transcriptional regulator / antitoxin HigA